MSKTKYKFWILQMILGDVKGEGGNGGHNGPTHVDYPPLIE